MNCPKCGGIINQGEEFCKTCGAKVESNNNVQPSPEPVVQNTVQPSPEPVAQNTVPNNNKNLMKILIPVVAALVILITAGILYFFVFASGSAYSGETEKIAGISFKTTKDTKSWHYEEDTTSGFAVGYDLSTPSDSKIVILMKNLALDIAFNSGEENTFVTTYFEASDAVFKKSISKTIDGKKISIHEGTKDNKIFNLFIYKKSSKEIVIAAIAAVNQNAYNKYMNSIMRMMLTVKSEENIDDNNTNENNNNNNTDENPGSILNLKAEIPSGFVADEYNDEEYKKYEYDSDDYTVSCSLALETYSGQNYSSGQEFLQSILDSTTSISTQVINNNTWYTATENDLYPVNNYVIKSGTELYYVHFSIYDDANNQCANYKTSIINSLIIK
jgi:hypothetical protein